MNKKTVQVATDDPVMEIMNSDRDRLRNGLQGALQDGPQSATEADTTAPAGEVSATSEDGASIGTGLQDILAKLPPEQHDSVRRIFADNTRLRQEQSGLDSRLESAVELAVKEALTEQPQQQPQGDVTEDQLTLFRQIADSLGYAKTDDILADKSSNYLDSANEGGIQAFGDDFGMLDSGGQFVLSQHQARPLTDTYNRLNDPSRGISYNDLYVLTHHKKLLQEAEERGRGVADGRTRMNDRVAGRVEGRPTTAAPSLNIRGEVGTTPDSSRNVMARAYTLAKKTLNSR